MKVFLVGSTGSLGKSLIQSSAFTAAGFATIRVSRQKGSDFIFDLVDESTWAWMESIESDDVVLMLAAISSPDLCQSEPGLSRRINVVQTKKLLKIASKKTKKIVFFSSDAVFGDSIEAAFEYLEPSPKSEYGVQKREIEEYVLSNGLGKVVRLSYVLCDTDKFLSYCRSSLVSGEVVETFAGFERNVVCVEDVTSGLIELLSDWENQKLNIYHFAGDYSLGREDLAKAIGTFPYRVVEAPERFWRARSKVTRLSNQSFRDLLGRRPLDPRDQVLAYFGGSNE